MHNLPQMIMIGSNAKNSGKTWLSTFLIKKFCTTSKIISLKAKFIYDDNDSIHIQSPLFEQNGYVIYQENDINGDTDTSKMLQAGATKAFFVQSRIEAAQKAVEELIGLLDDDYAIVCESNTLINWLNPSLFVLCSSLNATNIKADIDKMNEKSDLKINFDGKKFDVDVEKISYSKDMKKWTFVK